MAGTHGVKETSELLMAMKEISLCVLKAKQEADKKGSGVKGIGTELVPILMGNPLALAVIQNGLAGASDVPKELKDLQFSEIAELLAVAGKCVNEAAALVAPAAP